MSRSLTAHLAVMFAKARPVRWFAVMVAVTLAIVMVLLITAQSFQQSGEQNAQSSTGKADYMLTLPVSEPSGQKSDISDASVFAAMRQAGAVSPRSGFDIYQVPIDGHSPLWMNLAEQDWAANPFPGRYELLHGRLPARAGEVAISQELARALGRGHINLAGGALRLTIVGVVRDETNRTAPFGLILPGTWRMAGKTSGTFDISGTRSFYWNSTESSKPVVAAIVSDLNRANVKLPSMDEVLSGFVDHRALVAHKTQLYSELGVLLLLVPFLVGLIGGWIGSRFIRRIRQTLWQVGVGRTASAGTTAIVGSALVAALVGVGFGLAAGSAGARPLLDAVSNRRIGPVYGLDSFALATIGALLAGTSLGMMHLLRAGGQRPHPARKRLLPPFTQLLPALSLVLVFAGIFCTQSGDLNTRLLSPFLFGSAVVVLAPFALGLVGRIRSDSLPLTLAIRRLNAERKSASWTTVGVAAVLMLSFSTLLVNYSAVASANAESVSRVPQGQVQLVPAPNPGSGIENLHAKLEDFAGLPDPVMMSIAAVSSQFDDGPIMIVKTPRDVERLLGVSLSSAQAANMKDGALIRHKKPTAKSEVITFNDGATTTLPVVMLSQMVSNYTTFAGLVTQETADRLHFGSVQPSWVYTNLTDDQIKRLRDAPNALGFNPQWLILNEPPAQHTEPPATLLIAFAAGLLASLLVAYYTAATTRNLRPTLAALHGIGVRSRWLAVVSTAQTGAVILTAIVFAWTGAVIATFLSTQTWAAGAKLHIPWTSVGLLLATLLVCALTSQLLAKRNLSSLER